jgi:hypothetical protein
MMGFGSPESVTHKDGGVSVSQSWVELPEHGSITNWTIDLLELGSVRHFPPDAMLLNPPPEAAALTGARANGSSGTTGCQSRRGGSTTRS